MFTSDWHDKDLNSKKMVCISLILLFNLLINSSSLDNLFLITLNKEFFILIISGNESKWCLSRLTFISIQLVFF